MRPRQTSPRFWRSRATRSPPRRRALRDAGASVAEARPYRVLDRHHGPGALFAWTAPSAVTIVVAAPGTAMRPDEQVPATDLLVEVERAEGSAPALPPPLADVALDIRVPAAEARAYRVRAGDYIQIIDVEGRQCSDFLAFDAANLAEGLEKGLDATTTAP